MGRHAAELARPALLALAASSRGPAPFVPPQLELDLFDGRAYVGLVPFTMTGVRPVGLPSVWGLSSFHETNVRTYVRLAAATQASGSSVSMRPTRSPCSWPEACSTCPTTTRGCSWSVNALRKPRPLNHPLRRRSARPGPLPASYAIRATPGGTPQPAQPGTLEHFLVERYILYTLWKSRLYQCRVSHTPYPLQTANALSIDETILAAAGIDRPATPPLAHFASGVNVEVFPLRAIEPSRP